MSRTAPAAAPTSAFDAAVASSVRSLIWSRSTSSSSSVTTVENAETSTAAPVSVNAWVADEIVIMVGSKLLALTVSVKLKVMVSPSMSSWLETRTGPVISSVYVPIARRTPSALLVAMSVTALATETRVVLSETARSVRALMLLRSFSPI